MLGLLGAVAGCERPVGRESGVQAGEHAAKAESVELERFRVGDRRYAVPATHVHSIRQQPSGFVRIKHPEARVELVYDSRLEGARDPQGAPQVFSINDGRSPTLEYYQKAGGVVVCRRAASPRGGCGMKIRYGGAEWSVLFPYGLLDQADLVGRRAGALLNRYEL